MSILHARADLLDRQLVGIDGRLLGKVDDLALSEPDAEGTRYVVAVLTGPGALGPRLGGLGRLLALPRRHWRPPGDDVVEIPYGEVTEVGEQVTVRAARGASAVEDWLREHLIERIPGARHADG